MTERKCKKCGNHVPIHIQIDGKKRNCKNRKYCLDCSPFGQHNTRQLDKISEKGLKTCPDCQEEHGQKGNRCFRCYFQRRQKQVSAKIQKIVGSSCWICGYSKTKRNLCFHHVDESTKSFGLTTRELMLKWDRVFNEMKKCIFICHNCHGEVHDGLIFEERVHHIWKKEWNERLKLA